MTRLKFLLVFYWYDDVLLSEKVGFHMSLDQMITTIEGAVFFI